MPEEKIKKNFQNSETVISIENNARNNIKYTLDGVFDFMNFRHKDMAPQYKVLKSYLWFAGLEHEKIRDILSRVDIELINEQIKLFYSDQDVVTITYDEDTFTIIEYVSLGLNDDKTSYYP
jgi:hypothetical protein